MITEILMGCAVYGLVGALIGAGTNELALVWIFRKIIPKRKAELAAAIKSVIAEELVDPKAIADKLREDQVRGVVERDVGDLIGRQLARDVPSLNALFAQRGGFLDDFERRLIDVVADKIIERVVDETSSRDGLTGIVKSEIDLLLGKKPFEVWDGFERFLDAIPERTADFLQSRGFRGRAAMLGADLLFPLLTSEKGLAEILPPSLALEISEELRAKFPRIGDKVADFLERDQIQRQLAEAIERELAARIDEKTPAFMRKPLAYVDGVLKRRLARGSFSLIGLESEIKQFCRRIPDRVRREMSEESNEAELRITLDGLAEDFMRVPLRDFFNVVTRRRLQEALNGLYADVLDAAVRQRLGVQVGDLVRSALNADFKSHLSALAPAVNADFLAGVIVEKVVESARSEAAREWLRGELTGLARTLRAKPIGRLERHVDRETREAFARLATDALLEAVSGRIDDFTKEAGLYEIIEERVKGLDPRSIERLARRIADRELKLVVIMGGVIGFVIGVLQGVLSSIVLGF